MGVVIRRERQQLRVAPHVRWALGNSLASKVYRLIVITDFEGRKAILANRPGRVPPALLAFPAPQLVLHGSLASASGGRTSPLDPGKIQEGKRKARCKGCGTSKFMSPVTGRELTPGDRDR